MYDILDQNFASFHEKIIVRCDLLKNWICFPTYEPVMNIVLGRSYYIIVKEREKLLMMIELI